MGLKEDASCTIQKSSSPCGMTFFKNVLYKRYNLVGTGPLSLDCAYSD